MDKTEEQFADEWWTEKIKSDIFCKSIAHIEKPICTVDVLRVFRQRVIGPWWSSKSDFEKATSIAKNNSAACIITVSDNQKFEMYYQEQKTIKS